MRVVPGCGFTLEGHANSAFNQDWLVVRVEHFGKQTGSLDEEAGEEGNRYENTLFLIPHNKPWRSPLKPRPIYSRYTSCPCYRPRRGRNLL